jgi:heme-degrading monooxygenase HmoA
MPNRGGLVSVYMSLRVKADAERFEQYAKENAELINGISENAKQLGCIHHTFASENGDVVVMDEWESREAFEKFFNGNEDVAKVMQDNDVQSEPEIHFYKPLDTGDQF